MARGELLGTVVAILDDMQKSMLAKARAFRDAATKPIDTRKEFEAFFTSKNEKEIHGGFALSGWCGEAKCEGDAKEALKVTIRCIPTAGFEGAPWAASLDDKGTCVMCGKPSQRRVIFAKAY
jgi:prolyl-tRNA synthetase